MRRAAFGLGANLGDAEAALADAVAGLRDEAGVESVRVSSLFRTTPVGGPEQPDYLNAVAVADTDLPAAALLDLAHRLEQRRGRVRDVRWGPRTLDVDILAVAGEESADPDLTLPHPRAHQRAFVLVPWAEIDPDFEIPGVGPVREACDRLPPQDRSEVLVVRPGSSWSQVAGGSS